MRRACALLIVAVALAGCNVRAPQIEALQAAIQRPLLATDAEALAWEVEYDGYKAKVYPVNTTDGTQFISYDNDSLTFDGFILRRIDQLGDNIRRWVVDDDEVDAQSITRSVRRGRLSTEEQVCEPRYAKQQFVVQLCDSTSSEIQPIYVMEFNSKGELWRIYQTIGEQGQQLILTKLNP